MALWKHQHPLCLGCQAVGRVVATDVTDHIIPHKGDPDLLSDESNWQPACRKHHDVIKQQLERMYAAGRIRAIDLRLDSDLAKELTADLLW